MNTYLKALGLTLTLSSLFFVQYASAKEVNEQDANQKIMEEYLGYVPQATYHTAAEAINSQNYLPPPPAKNSAQFTWDKAAYQAGYRLKGTQRWVQASNDANLRVDNIAQIFSEPLGIKISKADTPTIYKMLGYLLIDTGGYAPQAAKTHYMRQRPFVYFNHHTCQPLSEEATLKKDGSYPSGHTAYGWVVALTLAQIRPEQAETLLKRGYEFGQSRVICGAHWQSDVDAGRLVGAAEYSRLQNIAEFQQDIKTAKIEIDSQLNKSAGMKK